MRCRVRVRVSQAAGKTKQKNVPKESKHEESKENNERIFLDIATVKRQENDNNKDMKITRANWRIMIDERRTQMKVTDFLETKSGMVEPTCEQLFKWKASGTPEKFLRLNNAGENQLLKNRAESSDWKLNVKF